MKETTKDLLWMLAADFVAIATPLHWLAITMWFMAGFWAAFWIVDASEDPVWQGRFERVFGDR